MNCEVHLLTEKSAGGIDEILEWSKTTPKRTQKRPAEKNGDFDDQVAPRFLKALKSDTFEHGKL